MKKDKLREVIENINERIDLEIGINPMTNEEGIKINGIPNEFDIIFIEKNRNEIIEVLKEIKAEKEIKKVEIKLELEEEIFEKLRKEAIDLETTLEKLIISKIK